MDARTATTISAHSARDRKAQALKLRVIHHKHAGQIAAHARIVRIHARKLLKLQKEIEREAVAVAGASYREYHDVGYDEYGSMESQRAIDDGSVAGPGLVDVVELASSIATYAARIAAEATPPPLPSE